jgi:flagellar M-ring protein FliF
MISRQVFAQLAGNISRLGTRRLVVLGLVGATIVAGVALSAHWLGRPTMQPIYTGLSSQDVVRMTAALAEAGLGFDVNEQRNAVLVPFGQAARARTLLAQRGLPTGSRAGYELYDQVGSIGLTSFMQEVTKVRVLEGEIARTIQALDGVAAARVHLVLADSGSLKRERREPSASVLLRIDGRWQSSGVHVVRHLVAAAIPGMKVDQISVASTDGRLMAAAGDEAGAGSAKLIELERSLASELEQRVGRTLAVALGSGNFQVSATVKLDVDRKQINETVFDPKSRVERSVRVVKQSGLSEDASNKTAVGVDANVPREETQSTDGDRRRQREDRREELVNYELNSKTVQTVRDGYKIERLALAVVVNRKQVEALLGSSTNAAALEAKLAEVRRLVAAAAGATADRTDSIEITAVDFGNVDRLMAPVPSAGLLDHLLGQIGIIVNAVTMLVVVFVVVQLGVRPLAKLLTRDFHNPAGDIPEVAQIAARPSQRESASNRDGLDLVARSPSASSGVPPLATAGSGDRQAAARERLGSLVASNEVKVAAVLKEWMSEARRS